MTLLKDKYDIGVIVGRFQVAELTEAHKQLISLVLGTHKQVIVVIGVSPTLGTKQHPLGYTARMQMVQKEYPTVIITHLMDKASDKEWSKDLDLTIRALFPIGSICLYGGRESFIPSYTGVYPTFELAVINHEQGTKIRDEIGKVICNSVDFRRGIIYACQNQYPKVFPTVDIAVVKNEGKVQNVLLARRKEGDLLQFPGGFVDPSDVSLEAAAKRELGEELDVEADEFKYVCSASINDWRYNNTSERIVTTLFRATYIFGMGKPIDEFHSSEWVPLNGKGIEKVKPNHRVLFKALVANLTK